MRAIFSTILIVVLFGSCSGPGEAEWRPIAVVAVVSHPKFDQTLYERLDTGERVQIMGLIGNVGDTLEVCCCPIPQYRRRIQEVR